MPGFTKRARLIAPWILLVVGAHVVPLAVILRAPGLHVLALLRADERAPASPVRGGVKTRKSAPAATTGGSVQGTS